MRYSPGSLIPGNPASATNATDEPSFSFLIIKSVLS